MKTPRLQPSDWRLDSAQRRQCGWRRATCAIQRATRIRRVAARRAVQSCRFFPASIWRRAASVLPLAARQVGGADGGGGGARTQATMTRRIVGGLDAVYLPLESLHKPTFARPLDERRRRQRRSTRLEKANLMRRARVVASCQLDARAFFSLRSARRLANCSRRKLWHRRF